MFVERLLVKLIAPTVHITQTDEDTAFEWTTDTIYYNPAQNPFDLGFQRHLREQHLFEKPEQFSIGLWSILHELGHYFNPDEEVDENAKALCAMVSVEVAANSPYIQDMYYNSPDEFAATEWACDWIMKHKILAYLFSAVV